MAGISTLPVDLITQTISNLQPDTTALSHLSRVSKAFYGLTIPVLYEHYVQPSSKALHSSSLSAFLHTILARPDLGRLIQRITLQHFPDTGCLFRPPDSPCKDEEFTVTNKPSFWKSEDIRLLNNRQDAIRQICTSWPMEKDATEIWKQHWLQASEKSSDLGLTLLLLAVTPNLGYLYIRSPCRMDVILPILNNLQLAISKMRTSTSKRDLTNQTAISCTHQTTVPSAPSKLHTIHAIVDGAQHPANDTYFDAAEYLLLPHLTIPTHGFASNLCGYSFKSNHSVEAAQKLDLSMFLCTPASLTVRKLHLYNSFMNYEDLRRVLTACSRLTEFYYTFKYSDRPVTHFSPPELLQALSLHQSSLEVLVISFAGDLEGEWRSLGWRQLTIDEVRFGTELQKFTRLRRLACEEQVLTGLYHTGPQDWSGYNAQFRLMYANKDSATPLSDLLPSSLTHLKVVNCTKTVIPEIEKFIQIKPASGSGLPNLRSVGLSFYIDADQELDIPLIKSKTFPVDIGYDTTHGGRGEWRPWK